MYSLRLTCLFLPFLMGGLSLIERLDAAKEKEVGNTLMTELAD